MNLKQLEIFTAIAVSGSFSKGAESACISQSTASQHIAALEADCGVRLLDRTGRGVIPTEAGRILLAHAQQVIKSLKEARQAMIRFRQADGVELAVGGSTIPGTYLLPKAVAALRAASPGITVTAEIGDSSEILAKVAGEHIELGVIGTAPDDRLFASGPLSHDEILLVARKEHRWCGRTDVQPAELLSEPMIMREKGSGTSSVVDTALKRLGLGTGDLTVCATLSGSEAIKQAVLAGCGVAFISEMAVREELKQGELTAIRLSGLTITRTFFVVSKKGRTLSPAAVAFSTMLRQVTS